MYNRTPIDKMKRLTDTSPEIAALLTNTLKKRETAFNDHLAQREMRKAQLAPQVAQPPTQLLVKPENMSMIEFRRKLINQNSMASPMASPMATPMALPIYQRPGNFVTVDLGAGLGNWIFKILAGLGYAEKNEKQFVMSRRNIHYGSKAHEKGLLDKITGIFPNVSIVDSVLNVSTITEKIQFKYSPLESCNLNVTLNGYFQDEQYFPSPNLIPTIKTSYYPNTYFVHIRAGDYIGSVEFGFDLVQYYKNCFSLLDSGVKYIVFSNDNGYADTYMKQFGVSYTLSDKVDQVDTLIEMANCAGGICANSSFSWLGGLFQGDTRGQIFMPSIWIKGKDCQGIYPSWATIISIELIKSPVIRTSLAFDIVIPVGPNDIDVIKGQIEYTKRNIIGYRNIFLIYKNTLLQIQNCITISEDIFPFTIKTVEEYHGKLSRNGWYLQQLLKLYAGKVIPGISENYLVIDSDTFFLKPVRFIDNNKTLYAYGSEYNIPYFDHMLKLHTSFKKMDSSKSGICHHMMFNTSIIKEMIDLVESYHQDKFFKVFLTSVEPSNYEKSGASEYELYFNYILQYHPNEILVRKLLWNNVECLTNKGINDYESVHWYIRKKSENIFFFESLKLNGSYAIIDIFRSSKYNSLVFLCNNKKYIKEKCGIDISSLYVEGYELKNMNVDKSKVYIEIGNAPLFPDRFHHEIFYIENFPNNISSVIFSLNGVKYSKIIPKKDTRFLNKKCLTTIQKDEVNLIEPWIEWHKKLGFEYFFIYDNNFNINSYSDLFKKYPTELFIYNADFPYFIDSYGRNTVGQVIQQNHTLWKFSPDFLGLTDLDEYIYPLSNFNIFNKGISVISIPNYWFGCSDNKTFNDKIVESYIKRETVENIIHHRKCIIQSLYVDLVCVHISLNYKGIYKRVNHSEIYLRHYRSLSEKKRKCDCSRYCLLEDIPKI